MLFTKMNGLGNDYIFINTINENVENPGALSEKLSDRHFGIGGDGLVLIGKSQSADFSMRIFNADGSEGKMCGNALRCVGKYVFEKKMTEKTELTIETLSGIKEVSLIAENGKVKSVSANIGRGKFLGPVSGLEVMTSAGKTRGYYVSVGNPHFVVLTNRISEIEKVGKEICENEIFPDGVNVEFVNAKDSHFAEVRVYERGSGFTLACGTGAAASFFVLREMKIAKESLIIRLPGGDLDCRIRPNNDIIISGPANINYEGQI